MKSLVSALSLAFFLICGTVVAQHNHAASDASQKAKSCSSEKAQAECEMAGDKAGVSDSSPSELAIIDGVQQATIVVKKGYSPSALTVKEGMPVRLNFKLEEKGCTGTVVFKDLNLKKKLAYGKVTPMEFTPDKAGTYTFACPMGMISGTLIVSNEGDHQKRSDVNGN